MLKDIKLDGQFQIQYIDANNQPALLTVQTDDKINTVLATTTPLVEASSREQLVCLPSLPSPLCPLPSALSPLPSPLSPLPSPLSPSLPLPLPSLSPPSPPLPVHFSYVLF